MGATEKREPFSLFPNSMVFFRGKLTALRLISEMRRLVEKFLESYAGWEGAPKTSYKMKSPEPSDPEQAHEMPYQEQVHETTRPEEAKKASYQEKASTEMQQK